MLENFRSHCIERQRIIVSSERGCFHRAINDEKCLVRQFFIDGEVITNDSEKCDKLVLNDDKRDAYYIELKGSDIRKAINQIANTEKILSDDLKGYTSFYRIIFKSGSHSIHTSEVLKWKERCGKDYNTGKAKAVIHNKEYEECI